MSPWTNPARWIQCTVADQGHVTLAGVVGTLRERDQAEAAVRNLDGVRMISNAIEIETPAVAPGALHTAIEHALERHAEHAAKRVHVAIAEGKVTLSGEVPSWAELAAVEGAVRGTPGVKKVENQLTIRT